jgi:hypothetical protein
MKAFFSSLMLAATLTVAAPASAAVIDFENSGSDFLDQLPSSWDYQGFTFQTTFVHYSTSNDYTQVFGGASNGTRHYINGFSDTVLSRTDGGAFSIASLDLGLADYTDNNADVTLTGTLSGGGTVSATFSLAKAFSSLTLSGFDNLSSLTFSQPTGTQGYIALDNIDYSAAGPGGVPEPANWMLMIGGFGIAGAAMRRRRMVAAA